MLNRYTERMPRPANPILRPAYQGSNPVADIFSFWALEQTVKYLPRVAKNRDDTEARRQLLFVSSSLSASVRDIYLHLYRLAASFAGIGFGNAGVHLCHGMSYPVRLSDCPSLFCLLHLTMVSVDLRTEQEGAKV